MVKKRNSKFKSSLYDQNEFTLTFELVPTRGGRSREHVKTLEFARLLVEDDRFQAISITDNAGGHAALAPEAMGVEIQAMGLDVIVHCSCKDKNRNQMESLLFAWDHIGLRNLLVITGDYPKAGYKGFPKPVFDLGSIQTLDLISRQNRGIFWNSKKRPGRCYPNPTSYLKGVAFSPFKRLESELRMQYFKLHKKVANGGDFIITQVGFDARKFHEILQYTRECGFKIPILGNVFIPNLTVSNLMYQGEVPGCEIADSLYNDMKTESNSPDKGKKARLIRAAKLLSVLKGMGYAGAHIGGPHLEYEDIDFMLNKAKEFEPQWQELVGDLDYWFPDGYYLYEKDNKTGLNTGQLKALMSGKKKTNIGYFVSRKFHSLMFDKSGVLYAPMKKVCLSLDGSRLDHLLAGFEHFVKFLGFGCKNCGDCALAELAFLCPQNGCAKYLLNGPCGGSKDGWCEVYPGKKRCFYVRVFERLVLIGAQDMMKDGLMPPINWSLYNTSSWVNFFRGIDHLSEDF
ncbi:MAG: methylenetetrahydrofolate reductase [Desulfobacteraceae bacterium]|nr:methylenetetrahydrofolate reductase [Desulfobacteraceae bacterium]